MTKFHFKFSLFKIIALTLSFVWLSFSNIAFSAGICDISGGNGIGGTGQIAHANGSGIGGTGQIAHGNGSGIGGTGQVAFANIFGIGGTGKPIQKQGNGIGGTGQAVSRLGFIVGTITGFGSICVNGIEIHYSSSTPLQIDGQNVNPENSFAIGQVVAVSISGAGNEVIANDMHILHVVRGPVSMVDIGKGEIEVLGQKVQLPVDSDRNAIKIGDYINVSGLRGPNGNIISSRIDEVVTQPTTVSVRGPISSISGNSFDIQGMKVNTSLPAGLSIGQEIQVSGQIDHNGFKADSITLSQDQQLSTQVGGLISIEGYLESTKNISTIEVAGRVIDIPDSLQEEIDSISEYQKVIVTGRFGENNVIQMEHILVEDILDRHDNLSHIQEVKSRHEQDKEDHEQKEDAHESIKTPAHETPEVHGMEDHEIETPEFEAPETPEIEAPETPEFEAPETPEFEAPETPEFEAPETPEFEAPETPEFEAPEIPEFEAPETPEFEAPEIPEFEAPEIPEFEAPEIPEFEAPEIPEFEAPEIPEFEAPEIPEFEAPEIPEFEAPEIPEFEAPEIPEFEAPETPEFEAPEIPEYEAPEI